jgi:hypothetical protein
VLSAALTRAPALDASALAMAPATSQPMSGAL